MKDESLGKDELVEKAKYLTASWMSTDREFKEFSLSMILLDWKVVVGYKRTLVSFFLVSCTVYFEDILSSIFCTCYVHLMKTLVSYEGKKKMKDIKFVSTLECITSPDI